MKESTRTFFLFTFNLIRMRGVRGSPTVWGPHLGIRGLGVGELGVLYLKHPSVPCDVIDSNKHTSSQALRGRAMHQGASMRASHSSLESSRFTAYYYEIRSQQLSSATQHHILR